MGQEPEASADDEPKGKTFDESYVKDLRKEAASYRTQLNETQARLDALEEKDKTDLEKAVARAERAEKERDGLKADLESERTERSRDQRRAWLSDAAAAENFHNPGSAARELSGEEFEAIDSLDAARQAVQTLAKRETWMVKPAEAARQGPEKVLSDGERVQAGGESAAQDPSKEHREFMAQLMGGGSPAGSASG